MAAEAAEAAEPAAGAARAAIEQQSKDAQIGLPMHFHPISLKCSFSVIIASGVSGSKVSIRNFSHL